MSESPLGQPSEVGIGSGESGAATLTPLARQYLDQTRPWVRFMAIMAFASAGLTALIAVVMFIVGVAGGFSANDGSGIGALGSALGGGMLALVYLALACVYIPPGLYLSRYAGAIRLLQTNCSAAVLEDAIRQQKSFWRFVGILTAIGLVIAVIMLGLAIVAGALGAVMASRP